MGDQAEKAVEAFFDCYVELNTPAAHCHYVAWAVPELEEKVDVKGQKVFILPSVYPYMWQDVQDSPDGPVSCIS